MVWKVDSDMFVENVTEDSEDLVVSLGELEP